MRNAIRRIDRATMLALVAIFVALGGTSYAAFKVTGKTVKDGTLSGKDVRDRSLGAADFAEGQLPAGPPGAPGPTGAEGPEGPRGEAGPSQAIAAGPAARRPLSAGAVTVHEFQLPAGDWILTADGLIDNENVSDIDRRARCQILVGAGPVADTGVLSLNRQRSGSESSADTESFHITGAASARSAQQARLSCSANSSTVFIEFPTLTATRVGELTRILAD